MKKQAFTLIEILIALGILGLGVLSITRMTSAAQQRCRTAEREWREHQAMTQATEYAMLSREQDAAPDFVFPGEDFRMLVEYLPPAGRLPADVSEWNGKWTFQVMRLTLTDRAGKSLRTLEINRIVERSQE